MLYWKNLSGAERALRIVAGVGMGALAYVQVEGTAGLALMLGGIGVALSGIAGFCPMCALAGRKTGGK